MSVRLRVIARDILVRCPHGQGYGSDGQTTLKDCYVDSATPGTKCSVMMLGGRCEQVAEFTKQTGWRAHVRTTEPETAHALPPVRLIYTPLDTAGTKWMAVNVMTGERKQIDMREVEPYVEARHGAYSAYLSGRRLGRLCCDGSQLSEPYEGWQGGGDAYSRREWCDCSSCVALRPRTSTKADPQDVYRESLPADLRSYWDAFQLRTEQWRKQMGMTSDTPRTHAGGIDFVNGFGQGHARSPYSVKSSQEPPRTRTASGARVVQTVSAPSEDDETSGSERAMLNKTFNKLAKKANRKPR